jgi:CheY-like chemotaxis protein
MGLFGVSVLMIEDDDQVAQTFEIVLKEGQPEGWAINYHIRRVATLVEARKFIAAGGWDVILLDPGLPNGQGIDSFRACYAVAQCPIIVVSGSIDLPTIQEMLREGAARCFDKVLLISKPVWLNYAIVAVIENWRLSQKVEQMQETLVGTLRNLITACSSCQRWRDPASGQYVMPDKFLENYNIFLSHSICPDCAQKRYGDLQTQIDNTPVWLAKNLSKASQDEIEQCIREVAGMENGAMVLEAVREGLDAVARTGKDQGG